MQHRLFKPAAAAAAGCVFSGAVQAAGFLIQEQSVSGLGNAFAGAGAVAEDATTVYWNPAGMMQLSGTQFSSAAHIISASFEFTDSGSTNTTATAAGAVTSATALLNGAGNSKDGGTPALVPNLYYVTEIDDDWRFGVGVNAPFGLSTEYDSNWNGRYHTVKSEIKTININPSLAWKANDKLSLGAGLNIQYITAELTNVVDYAAIGAVLSGGALALGAPGTLATAAAGYDGFVTNEADNWGLGFNFGAQFQVSDQTRLSLTYRSKIRHSLEGNADFTLPTGPTGALAPTLAAVFADTNITVKADLPELVTFGFAHQSSDRLELLGEASFTGWDSIPELRIDFANVNKADSVEELRWENTWRIALGLNYQYTKALKLRAGIAYDESPVPNAAMRTPRLPDADRTWLSVGASYMKSDKLSFDVAFTHIIVDDPNINRDFVSSSTVAGTGTNTATLNGSYDAEVNILSAQLNYKF